MRLFVLDFGSQFFSLGISPCGRIVGRSLLYGGKAAEVSDIINRGTITEALTGTFFRGKDDSLFFSFSILQRWDTYPKMALKIQQSLPCMMEQVIAPILEQILCS